MDARIPTIEELRSALEPLGQSELMELAAASGVPFHTLLKLRRGETQNPRLDTVRSLIPHLRDTPSAERAAAVEALRTFYGATERPLPKSSDRPSKPRSERR